MTILRHANNRLRQRIRVNEEEREKYRIFLSEIAYYLPSNKRAIVILSRNNDRRYNVAIIKNKKVITFFTLNRKKIYNSYIERDYLLFEVEDGLF